MFRLNKNHLIYVWTYCSIERNQILSSYHQFVECCLSLSESRYIFFNGQELLLLRHLPSPLPFPPVYPTHPLTALTALILQFSGNHEWAKENNNSNYINHTTCNCFISTVRLPERAIFAVEGMFVYDRLVYGFGHPIGQAHIASKIDRNQ